MIKIYDLIDNLNIDLDFVNLPQNVSGLHCKVDDYNLIAINKQLSTWSDIQSVIAEEIGHYYTSSGNHAPLIGQSSQEELDYLRCEFKATRWACDYLLPTEDLLKKIQMNTLKTKEDIMNHYDITENILNLKFYYMSLEKTEWNLFDGRFLILSSLPSIYIYAPINTALNTLSSGF